jgi:hypothetical protein
MLFVAGITISIPTPPSATKTPAATTSSSAPTTSTTRSSTDMEGFVYSVGSHGITTSFRSISRDFPTTVIGVLAVIFWLIIPRITSHVTVPVPAPAPASYFVSLSLDAPAPSVAPPSPETQTIIQLFEISTMSENIFPILGSCFFFLLANVVLTYWKRKQVPTGE